MIDGEPAFLLRNGKYNDANGLYRRQRDGSYVSGTLPDQSVRRWLGNGAYIWDIEAHDLDGDLDDDLILEGKLFPESFLLENTGAEFVLYQKIATARGQPIHVGDLDGDGDLDIVNTGGGDDNGNSTQFGLWINQSTASAAPDPDPEPEADAAVIGAADAGEQACGRHSDAYCNRVASDAAYAALMEGGNGLFFLNAFLMLTEWPLIETAALAAPEAALPSKDPDPAHETAPAPEPPPEPAPEPLGTLPLPAYDLTSDSWARFVQWMNAGNGKPQHNALIGFVTDSDAHCQKARAGAQAIVDADDVDGNQYLTSGRKYADVFSTLAWCGSDQASAWTEWGARHLGEPDGSVRNSIWWSRRWSRNNPANNYYHSFIEATSVYAMTTGDQKWLEFLKDDRLPLMFDYYATTPEGGSREGTAYGESHREVFRMAKLWRDYDGTEIVPQAFIDGSLLYWTHAIMPGGEWMALLGDQTRTHGKTDGYHKDILDNALLLASDPRAISAGRWAYSLVPQRSAVFTPLFLTDHPAGSPPGDLAYHAKGAGVLFVRDAWRPNATALYFTAGIHDEAHQCEDQGGFAVWADGQWKTVGDHPWTRTGICTGKPESQNIINFGSDNARNSESFMAYTLDGVLSVRMDLSPAGPDWTRNIEWIVGDRRLNIEDTFSAAGEFQLQKPSADDERAPYNSNARVEVTPSSSGAVSVVSW
jgi:hypothetical protein